MKTYRIFFLLFILVATLATGPCLEWDAEDFDFVLVTRAIDGDTIELESGEVVRYIGVDTPETVHPTEQIGCYGPEASEFNRGLVEGVLVRLDYDVDKEDWYGRTLAYVYLCDGTFINAVLIEKGYGRAISYAPNTKHSSYFMDLQRRAMMDGAGMWSECYAEGEVPVYTLPVQQHCQYIASVKQDVFHYISCHYVDNIKTENRLCFANIQAALDSGRRPCKICLASMHDGN